MLIFNVSKIKKRNGTEINPPPIPNNPAKNPLADAAIIINTKKYQYSLIIFKNDRVPFLI